jgi:hypothetical protein
MECGRFPECTLRSESDRLDFVLTDLDVAMISVDITVSHSFRKPPFVRHFRAAASKPGTDQFVAWCSDAGKPCRVVVGVSGVIGNWRSPFTWLESSLPILTARLQ